MEVTRRKGYAAATAVAAAALIGGGAGGGHHGHEGTAPSSAPSGATQS